MPAPHSLPLPLPAAKLQLLPKSELLLIISSQHHQLLCYRRSGSRPKLNHSDRLFWVLLSRFCTPWQSILVFVQPETVLRWQRKSRQLAWTIVSRAKGLRRGRPPLSQELICAIQLISRENSLWGGLKSAMELLMKLGIKVSPNTVRKYRSPSLKPGSGPGSWKCFLKRHAHQFLAIDLITTGNPFSPFYVLTVLHHGSRQILSCTATKKLTLDWVKQQLTAAFSRAPAKPLFLIHDNDRLFGQFPPHSRHQQREKTGKSFRCHLDKWLSETHGIRGVPTPYHAPKANSLVERFQRSLQVEALNHYLFFRNTAALNRILCEYVRYHNHFRPHQGIKAIPKPDASINPNKPENGRIESVVSRKFRKFDLVGMG